MKKTWFSNTRGDILSGMTVALALIPEAISFAIILGVDPMVGLYASFCIAITIAFFGGRPGMISAATGAMALVMVSLVKEHGIEFMFAATVLTGVMQFVLGKFKVGQLVNFVPHSVVLGFVNSLAILIFLAQIPHFIGESWVMFALVAGTLLIIYLLPRITTVVPSPLVAIIIITIISIYTGAGVRTVGDMGSITRSLPMFHLPSVPLTLDTLKIILPYSFTLTAVGLLESLLTATIVDEMTETKGNMNQEVEGQGIANVVAGVFGGMAGCAMIGQSVINVKSGGRTRLSTLVSGLFLLFLIIVLGDIVAMIPMAALVGVMIMVSISTFEWYSIKEVFRIPKTCAFGMISTMAIVVATHNLAQGVFAGIAITSMFFAWKIMDIKVVGQNMEHDGVKFKIYQVQGQIYFASITKLIDAFDYANDPAEIRIDFTNAHIWDHSAIVGLKKIKTRYEKIGKKISTIGLNSDSHSIIQRMDPDFS
jgi:SulP family sulfate permease